MTTDKEPAETVEQYAARLVAEWKALGWEATEEQKERLALLLDSVSQHCESARDLF